MARRTRLPRLLWTRACCVALLAGAEAGAVPLLDGFGGPDGYGTPEHCVAAGDDNSYAAPGASEPTPIDLAPAFPAGLPFYGRTLTRFYLNTNGNITFAAPLATPNATAFPVADQPMIAPWWADVDTRNGGSVCYHLEPGLLVVTWHDVGFSDASSERRNDFQLVLSVRPACDYPGEINLDFRYRRCEWTGGDDGATVPAQVGFDVGNRMNYVALPMSRSAAIADVCRLSNRANGPPGFFRFDLGRRVFSECAVGFPCVVSGQAGLCAAGQRRCIGGAPVCAQVRAPEARVCDGLDHDCDGYADEGDGLCPDGQVCARARCVPRCGPANTCPAGSVCAPGGGCIEAACVDVACPEGERCVGGRCVSVCEGVTCRRGQHCVLSRCVDLCTETACEAPSFCDDDPASPSNGRCILRCECERCSDGRACGADGRCVAIDRPDAGSVVDAGAPTDLGAATDLGPAADVTPATDVTPTVRGRLVDAGCGCRADAPARSRPLGGAALLAALLARRRRRR